MTTLSPALMGTPPISVSRVTVRRKLWIELPQRSISSTPESHSDGSSRSRCGLLGVVDQGQQRVVDQVAGGLVAGHDEA